jgi:Ca2+:H+ antiporter
MSLCPLHRLGSDRFGIKCLGTCLFIGGYKHDCQFNATAASTMASLMVVASSSLIVPAALNLAFPSISIPLALPPTAGSATSDSLPAILILSRGTSLILLVLYLIYLHFQLISHTHLFCEPHDEPESPGEHSNASNASTEAPPVTLQPPMAIGVLAIVSLLIAMCAENLVSTLDDVVSSMHINRTFIGLIILPIVGNAAEYVSAFRASARGKMSLALGVAVGSSMQIALFVTPALVILGWVLGQPMSLSFEPFGAVVFYLSVIVVEGVISDGDSNYLEGAMLVGVYMIVALGFFVFPTE